MLAHAPPVDVQMALPHETRERVSVLDAHLAQPRSNGNTLHCLPLYTPYTTQTYIHILRIIICTNIKAL